MNFLVAVYEQMVIRSGDIQCRLAFVRTGSWTLPFVLGKSAYLACSAAWQSEGKCREDTSPRLSRTYNKTIALKNLRIYQEWAILISRTSKRPDR